MIDVVAEGAEIAATGGAAVVLGGEDFGAPCGEHGAAGGAGVEGANQAEGPFASGAVLVVALGVHREGINHRGHDWVDALDKIGDARHKQSGGGVGGGGPVEAKAEGDGAGVNIDVETGEGDVA